MLNEIKDFEWVKPFLTPRQYEALIYRFYFDFTYERIGELMGVTFQTAQELVEIAIKRIKRAIEEKHLKFPIE